MKIKTLIALVLMILTGLGFGYFYMEIGSRALGNEIGVILGFMLATMVCFFVLSVDLLLSKPKEGKQNE